MKEREHWRAIAAELGLPSEPEAELETEEDTFEAEPVEEREESQLPEEPAWQEPWSAPPPVGLRETAETAEEEEPDAEVIETELPEFVSEEVLVEPFEGNEEMAGAGEETPRRGRRRGRRGKKPSRDDRPERRGQDEGRGRGPQRRAAEPAAVEPRAEAVSAKGTGEEAEEQPVSEKEAEGGGKGRRRRRSRSRGKDKKPERSRAGTGSAPGRGEEPGEAELEDLDAASDRETGPDLEEEFAEMILDERQVESDQESDEAETEDEERETEEDDYDIMDEEDPYADWNIPSWQELIASLYRPER